jgi:hypothetical protein
MARHTVVQHVRYGDNWACALSIWATAKACKLTIRIRSLEPGRGSLGPRRHPRCSAAEPHIPRAYVQWSQFPVRQRFSYCTTSVMTKRRRYPGTPITMRYSSQSTSPRLAGKHQTLKLFGVVQTTVVSSVTMLGWQHQTGTAFIDASPAPWAGGTRVSGRPPRRILHSIHASSSSSSPTLTGFVGLPCLGMLSWVCVRGGGGWRYAAVGYVALC